jgi:voltage-gated potassium channel Kch
LLYVFVSAIISALSVLMKNTGLAVVLFVAINFLFTIIGTVTTVASIFIDPEDSTTVKIFEILQKANPFLGAVIGRGTSYSLTDVLCILIPVVAGTALCIVLGLTVFKKKDLK